MSFKTLTFPFILFCCSCVPSGKEKTNSTQQLAKEAQWTPPPAGTIIDSLKQRITEDPLNELYFEVSIKSTLQSSKGVYNLKLAYGHNEHEVTITLPKWTGGIILKPMLKPAKEKYHCFVGFSAGDSTFHELYEVQVKDRDIDFKQTKAYYLQ